MMYVARHAWPSADIIKQADHRIRNYVWASAFRVPERATAGWVHKQWAEQTLLDGGLGVPNIATELKALAAMVVGVWAMTTRPQEQLVGDILQVRDRGDASHLVPHLTKPAKRTGSTLWDAGRQWTELHFHEQTGGLLAEREGMKEVRGALRCANGVRSQWTGSGLEITCDGVAKDLLRELRRKLGEMRGRFSKEATHTLQLRDLWLGDSQGSEMTWKQYKHLYSATTNTHLGEVIRISKENDGAVKFQSLTHVLPMTSRVAHAFREVCLSIVANFPSLYGRLEEEKLLSIRHQGEDPHHVFELGDGDNAEISHTWGAQAAKVVEDESIQAAVAKQLQMEEASVIVAPHPWLTRMRPLWTGNRRWKQTRKGYKKLINRQRHVQIAADRVERTATTDAANVGVSKALSHLTWKRLYRMVGVSAYQTQNLYRLKMNRLRLWAGVDQGYRCMAPGCGSHASVGTMHLIWECPEARQFWEALRGRWGMAPLKTTADNKEALNEIFACRLKRIPEWLVQWGHTEGVDKWGDLQRTASEMWVVGVAVTVTAIWRWNVDRIHEADSDQLSLSATTMRTEAATREAYIRYRMSLLPLTGSKITRSRVAEEICRRWCREAVPVKETQPDSILRVGFFDGGSRGNPGPGGSGSVVVQVDTEGSGWRPLWAAATALGRADTTNNVAEFVGLHRLLEHAVRLGWRGLHVVGDSQMILRLMQTRKALKAQRLKQWYQDTSKLADICQVASWSHHYRKFNKTADWLANTAMDGRRSIAEEYTMAAAAHRWRAGVEERMESDVEHWRHTRRLDGRSEIEKDGVE